MFTRVPEQHARRVERGCQSFEEFTGVLPSRATFRRPVGSGIPEWHRSAAMAISVQPSQRILHTGNTRRAGQSHAQRAGEVDADVEAEHTEGSSSAWGRFFVTLNFTALYATAMRRCRLIVFVAGPVFVPVAVYGVSTRAARALRTNPGTVRSEGMIETTARAQEESRFDFGRNWQRFLAVLNDERIAAATDSLHDMLGMEVAGARFLDVGSGSGLSSLAASRLGAARIHSFDFDEQSVACTRFVRDRYGPSNVEWTVERGSALDAEYLATLGEWDIVYSWGVLHHTGAMWDAIHRVSRLVRADGLFFLSIYNDQGRISDGWKMVKRLCNSGRLGNAAVLTTFIPYYVGRGIAEDLRRFHNPRERYRTYYRNLGMSMVHDWLDWLGGYPFEVAPPDAVSEFCRDRGLRLERLRTAGRGSGCNEFVFRRIGVPVLVS